MRGDLAVERGGKPHLVTPVQEKMILTQWNMIHVLQMSFLLLAQEQHCLETPGCLRLIHMDHFNSSVCYNTVGLVYKMGPGTGRLNLPWWISPDVCLIKNPIPDSHQCQTCQRKVRLTKEVSACDLHVCVVVSADSVLHLPVMQSLTCFQIVILYNHNYWRHMANVFHEGVLLKPPRKQTLQKSVTFICEKTHYLNMTDL